MRWPPWSAVPAYGVEDDWKLAHAGEERVAVGAGIVDVEAGAWAAHLGVHGQGTLAEAGRDLVLQPAAQQAALGRAAALDAPNARLQLEQRDRAAAG